MAAEEDLQDALLAIHSRLGLIEGKVNLVARAERERLIAVIEEAVKKDPLLGQIYLLLDGKRRQQDIQAELARYGVTPSQPTMSRRMKELLTEYGIADPSARGPLKRNRAAEDILNLAQRIRKWLSEIDAVLPETPRRRVSGAAE
jgi:hypothetical protein